MTHEMRRLYSTFASRLLVCLALGAVSREAHAANWTLSLNNPNQAAAAGATVVYNGVITNSTGGPLPIDVSLGFATSPASETFTIDFSEAFVALELVVPTSGYTGPIFQIRWHPDAVAGTFGEGELQLSAADPADPSVVLTPFSLRVPGIASFCREATGFNAASASVAADDSTGFPVMAYNDAGAGTLRFGTAFNHVWSTQLIASGIGTVAEPSLALDGNRKPLIAYCNGTTLDLVYAEKPGASWVLTPLDTSGDVGREPSLIRDGLGTLHVSYYDATNQDLKYARRVGASWTTELVDGTNAVGRHSAVTADVQGLPYISYFDETNGDLRLARKPAGSWITEVVSAGGTVGTNTDVAVAGGIIYIAFRDESAGAHALKFAYGTPGSWTFETIDNVGDPGLSTSLAVDDFGVVRIVYVDGAGGVHYGIRTPGVGWELGPVDASGIGHASLALDSAGEPFVSYGLAPNSLRFASLTACVTVAVPEDGASAAALKLLPNRPNPFSPSTTIAFELGQSALAQVRIFDASGRLVAEPVHQTLAAGVHRFEWSGVDRQGHRLPSGIYLYEVRTGLEERRGRMVLVR